MYNVYALEPQYYAQLIVQFVAATVSKNLSETSIHSTQYLIGSCQRLHEKLPISIVAFTFDSNLIRIFFQYFILIFIQNLFSFEPSYHNKYKSIFNKKHKSIPLHWEKRVAPGPPGTYDKIWVIHIYIFGALSHISVQFYRSVTHLFCQCKRAWIVFVLVAKIRALDMKQLAACEDKQTKLAVCCINL